MTNVGQSLLGTETVRGFRSKGIKSIVVGLSANDLADAFHSAGADNFLLKPFPCKEAELRIKLMKILEHSELHSDTTTEGTNSARTNSNDSAPEEQSVEGDENV